MNKLELVEFLKDYPDDMPVIFQQYSDYSHMEADMIGVVTAVDKGGYIMRFHKTMSEENKRGAKVYLCFPGN